MSKKVFVTGISGFAGSYLASELIKDENTEIYGSYLSSKSLNSLESIASKLKLFQLDLTDYNAVLDVFKKNKIDQLYHLAAIASATESFNNPSLVINNNIASQLNVLEALRQTGQNAKIMVVSSAEVYGKVDPKDIPIDEETRLNPGSPYAVSKISQDFFGLQYYNSYGMNIFRVRPFNHIGPGQAEQFATSAFAKKIAEIEKNKREPVLTVGNLNSQRDFTDVKDMVRAYTMLMEKAQAPEVYNLGSGVSYKMSKILDILLSFSKVKINVEVDKSLIRPFDNPLLTCNNTKMVKLTGWYPKISIKESLKNILEYWREKV